jgi:hypothetical protein
MWYIPAEHRKGQRCKKVAHWIPLPPLAVSVLRELAARLRRRRLHRGGSRTRGRGDGALGFLESGDGLDANLATDGDGVQAEHAMPEGQHRDDERLPVDVADVLPEDRRGLAGRPEFRAALASGLSLVASSQPTRRPSRASATARRACASERPENRPSSYSTCEALSAKRLLSSTRTPSPRALRPELAVPRRPVETHPALSAPPE